MRAANKHKMWLVAALAIPLLAAGTWLVAAERGPFECDNGCQIGYPKPDPATLDYIERMKPLFNRWFGDVFWNKGDIYIVCNATYCAKYYITDDFGIFGTNDGRMEREGGDGSGTSSGGGEAGGQGGYNPGWDGGGGGGTGGGTGTVYVGDPQTVQE